MCDVLIFTTIVYDLIVSRVFKRTVSLVATRSFLIIFDSPGLEEVAHELGSNLDIDLALDNTCFNFY